MWLNKAELRKSDRFQVSSKVPSFHPSYPTLVHQSFFIHATLLQRSRCKQMSAILTFRQLAFFQSVTFPPDDDVRRRCTLPPSRSVLHSLSAPQCQGPPKQTWVSKVYRMIKMAVEIAEDCDMLSDLFRDAVKWRSKVGMLTTPLVFPARVSPYAGRMNQLSRQETPNSVKTKCNVYVSTLCVTSLWEHSMCGHSNCDHSVGALYVWPL